MAQDFTFLNHVRFGLSTAVVATDGPRAILNVQLAVAADGVPHNVALPAISVYGPGDVTGFDARAVMRTEPVAGAVDFDTTAMAAIDFPDEDFPWRYSPTAETLVGGVAGGRLTPWLTLLVLSGDEYQIENGALTDIATHAVPDPIQAWAWAHVQVNRPIALDGQIDPGRTALRDALAADPGVAFSRLLCPRRLSAQTAYRGFVVPTFEAGRLAGLGLAVDGVPAPRFAWAARTPPPPLPIYYQFAFSTGEDGNFESLVRRLQPWVASPKDNLGRRLMDVTPWPGDPQANTLDETPALWLEGALRVPGSGPARDPLPDGSDQLGRWGGDDRPAFTAALKPLLQARLGRAPATEPAVTPDPDAEPDDSLLPLIAPPVYGAGHAAIRSLDADAAGRVPPPWIADLNLDPAYRVSAGFGTRDVQRRQEDYMARAWAQYGDLFSINRLILTGQFWRTVGQAIFVRALPKGTVAIDHARTLGIARPAQAVVPVGDANLKAALAATTLKPAMVGGAYARIARANGPLVRRAVAAADLSVKRTVEMRATLAFDAVASVAKRDVVIAPTMLRPSGRITMGAAAAPIAIVAAAEIAEARPELVRPFGDTQVNALKSQSTAIRRASSRRIRPDDIGRQFFRLGQEFLRGRSLRTVGRMAGRSVVQYGIRALGMGKDWVAPPFRSALAPDRFSARDFADAGLVAVTIRQASDFAKRIGAIPGNRESWGRLQDAVTQVQRRIDLDLQLTAPPAPKADIAALAAAARKTLEPMSALTARLKTVLDLGIFAFPERLDPIMPAPLFTDPMQKALAPRGKEDRLLPNIAAIPNNSVTLLENNQAFIESYMAGLNHEMARELLWREYPTDWRGSYFRRFWDTDACPGLTDEQRDGIKLVHGWKKELGGHPANPAARDAVVVTIRGDLLRRYPNTDIYAVRSWWIPPEGQAQTPLDQERRDAIADRFPKAPLSKWTRVPDPREWNEPELPADPDEFTRWPIFRGVAADCTFIGLPLKAAEMMGDGVPGSTKPGWYIVLREKVGEPRFGADDNFLDSKGNVIGPSPLKTVLASWNDLDWEHYGLSGGSLSLQGDRWRMPDLDRPGQPHPLNRPALGSSHAGDIAAALLQRPVKVYIHASELLPEPSA